MNFGKMIKDEIVTKPEKTNVNKRSFIAGYLRGNASVFSDENGTGLILSFYKEELRDLIFSYVNSLYKIDKNVFKKIKSRGYKTITYSVYYENCKSLIEDLDFYKIDGENIEINHNFYEGIVTDENTLKSFVKGLFISCGNCYVPDDKVQSYHLELVFYHSMPASRTMELLSKYSINAKITRRKGSYLLYIKSAEEIKNFIAFLGASVSVLKLTDIMIEREIVNDSNRRANCDLGNVSRQVEATEKVIIAINSIKESGKFKDLKKELQETCNLRVKYKDDTYQELSDKLNISKSCLNHRLRKIVSISKEK